MSSPHSCGQPLETDDRPSSVLQCGTVRFPGSRVGASHACVAENVRSPGSRVVASHVCVA